MMDLELIKNVENWAEDRGILNQATPIAQMRKTVEEVSELQAEIVDGRDTEGQMELGDVVVTLIIQCKMQGWDIGECLQMAYDKIKGRSGEMRDGQFVRDRS